MLYAQFAPGGMTMNGALSLCFSARGLTWSPCVWIFLFRVSHTSDEWRDGRGFVSQAKKPAGRNGRDGDAHTQQRRNNVRAIWPKIVHVQGTHALHKIRGSRCGTIVAAVLCRVQITGENDVEFVSLSVSLPLCLSVSLCVCVCVCLSPSSKKVI